MEPSEIALRLPEWVIPEGVDLNRLWLELMEVIAYYSGKSRPQYLCRYCKSHNLHALGAAIAASLAQPTKTLEINILDLYRSDRADFEYIVLKPDFDFRLVRLEWLKQLQEKLSGT